MTHSKTVQSDTEDINMPQELVYYKQETLLREGFGNF
jgi:hypothetical protein